ncbi:thiamine pyrophosphate-dependent acetolactate synthase large subunit-like protein [Catenibacillus scindens]|uniref:Thiamine pyrophosphate-dependent acetolactate synthase large subunit-like protein n=2 Tax=Catenibacillus scindens TaxID=673271 RepID=A0A7W8M5I3_9FIRM|nr:thiamine pyrophosphate-dependent enzyme [Catenibacillus scindens]MBB5265253.1 thiamine pyrophosphate-dependent acetolactate synthase large subunit-like protein [Catenibacillus scindens]
MDIDQPVISFSDLAQSMGVKGCQVKEPSLLADTIREAMDSNEPRVVEVFIESK